MEKRSRWSRIIFMLSKRVCGALGLRSGIALAHRNCMQP
jgi:hypothetical protein